MDKKLEIVTTNIEGLYVIELLSFEDERGIFSRLFCHEGLGKIFNGSIKQINHSVTHQRGTARGFHFQYEPYGEVKILKCIRGEVFDTVVDIRKNSKTFLQTFSIKLSSENQKMLYIPKGFAHGFQTLQDETELLYFHSSIYKPLHEGALHVNDPLLQVEWPLEIVNLSQRDREHQFIDKNFKGV